MSRRPSTRPPLALSPRWRARARWTRARMRRGFWGPALTLVTGSAVAQGLAFAARPLLTRIYTPADFGVLTLLVALSAILLTAVTGRYDDALMLPRDDGRALQLLKLALGLSALGGAVTLGAVALADAAGWTDPAWHPALYPLGLVVALGGSAAALETWHTRKHRYATVSRGRVAQAAAVVSLQAGLGWLAAGALGLVAGAAAGFLVLVLVLAFALRADAGVERPTEPAPESLKALASRYRRFPLWSAPAALLNVFSSRLPVLVLAPLFGAGPVGLFGLAYGSLALPLGLLCGSLGQVFYAQAPAAFRDGRLGPLARALHRRLLAFVLVPAGAVALAGPELFGFVFGEDWQDAGVFARWIAPWAAFAAVASSLTRLFDVTEQQRADLGASLALALTLATALGTGAWTGQVLPTVATVGCVGAVARLAHGYVALRTAGVGPGPYLKALGAEGLRALPALVPVAAGAWLGGPALGAGLTLGAGVYAAQLMRRIRAEEQALLQDDPPSGTGPDARTP